MSHRATTKANSAAGDADGAPVHDTGAPYVLVVED